MLFKSLPFILGCVLAVILSFVGDAPAFIGGMILVASAIFTGILFAVEDENIEDLKKQIKNIKDLYSDSYDIRSSQFESLQRQIDSQLGLIKDLHQRILAVDSKQSGNDPFGG